MYVFQKDDIKYIIINKSILMGRAGLKKKGVLKKGDKFVTNLTFKGRITYTYGSQLRDK